LLVLVFVPSSKEVYSRENYRLPHTCAQTQKIKMDVTTLVELTITYKVSLVSFVVCWGIYFASDVLFARLFPFYAKLSKGDRAEWGSRVVSTLHAIVATYGSIYALFNEKSFREDPFLGQPSAACQWYLKVSIGYFLYDLVLVLAEKQLRTMGTIIYHVLGLVGFPASISGEQVQFFTILQNSTEITTPFVNNRWFLAVSKQANSQFYMINGLVMTFGFVLYRAVIIPSITLSTFYYHWDKYQQVSDVIYFLLPVCEIGISLLNFYWSYLMVRGMLKHLQKKNPKAVVVNTTKAVKQSPVTTRKTRKHAA